MTVVDDETSRLWQLLTELSAQLSANREHCESLKRQCDALKTQAVHTGTGFTLRRFNTDITKEQFDSELERFNATLVLENQALQYENRQLSMLLKDYEGTLDNVMARFRSFAHSSQQFDLDSARHYEQLLLQHTGHVPSSYGSAQGTSTALVPPSSAPLLAATRAGGASAAAGGPGQMMHPILQVQDPLALQWSLAHLSSLLRKALRSMQGEDDGSSEESSESSDEDSTSADDEDASGGAASKDEVQYRPRSRAENPPAAEQELAKSKSQPSRASMSPTRSAARSKGEDTRHHKHDEGEGGYLRLLLDAGYDKSHAALERDIELERLRSENQALRELLAVASDPAVV